VSDVKIFKLADNIAHDAAKAARVTFVSKENGGLGDARNFGISIAKGMPRGPQPAYIFFGFF
jgi:glycosyltransferase involved in cell wall biosynthesis